MQTREEQAEVWKLSAHAARKSEAKYREIACNAVKVRAADSGCAGKPEDDPHVQSVLKIAETYRRTAERFEANLADSGVKPETA